MHFQVLLLLCNSVVSKRARLSSGELMIKVSTIWQEKMKLSGEAGGHIAILDAKSPLGSDAGMTPKEMVALGVCGCTAMDVLALLKKHKQPLEKFDVTAEIETTEKTHPIVFKNITLSFNLTGQIDKAILTESVRLSQTKYCSVSAMIAKAAPIHYKIILNGEEVGTGDAHFE